MASMGSDIMSLDTDVTATRHEVQELPMMWIWIGLLAWLAMSPVVAVTVGRAVSLAEARRAH